ncbi:hypothetical protein Sspor_69520 [Streptomyces spororaveus]|uniref:Thioesterase domain-containing protein n=1 Tax=Streptomyces spororaveus TaxID=284039 RepID=A0ABQ3TLU4_9ACTN|nr:alpha/beta fold hydrolase [Streptomyces spororaveus]GHI81391.1 hypothetical protein Sspor_69520 [Streptomyces spororaveus]
MTVSHAAGSWFRRFSTGTEDGMTLLCFPHAGGAASTYFPMSKLLAPRIGVYAVQYPGRQDRRSEPPLDELTQLADRITEALTELAPDRPLALFGHSMGALLAYEVARRLETTERLRPIRLFVSGRRAPGHAATRPDLHDQDDATILAELRRLSGTDEAVLADDDWSGCCCRPCAATTRPSSATWGPDPGKAYCPARYRCSRGPRTPM